MSTPSGYIVEDKKDPVLANAGVLESGNESDSIDTITALVIEGNITPAFHPENARSHY